MRARWVDNLKGIGILLVVYGHVYKGLVTSGLLPNNQFYQIHFDMIYSIHMPVFFFVSGLFVVSSIKRSGKNLFLLSKLDSVVYPYLLWSVIQLGCKLVMSGHVNRPVEATQLVDILWQPIDQFWFLYSLFLFFVASYFLLDASKSRIYLIALFGVSVALYLIQSQLSFSFQSSSFARYFIFFMFGVLFNAYDHFTSKNNRIRLITYLIAALVAHYLFFLKYQFNIWESHFSTLLVSLISIVALQEASKKLSETRITMFEKLGQASLVIYLTHILTGSGIRIFLNRFLDIHDGNIHLLAGCFFGLFIPLVIFQLSQKFKANFLFSLPISQYLRNRHLI